MSLQDDLKSKTLALVSQQMANWVVDIQRQIGDNQANLVKALDELQESVARYDEKIDEAAIGQAMADVVAAAGGGGGGGPSPAAIKTALSHIDAGSNLSEVLTHLVDQAATLVQRAAIFIVKSNNAIGWYASGINPPEAVKQLNIPLGADTIFRSVSSGRQSVRANVAQSPGTGQVIARLGGSASGILGVPLILRDKIAAILYCDTSQPEFPAAEADAVEVLVQFASKTIDLLSLAPKQPGARPQTTASGPVRTPTGPVRPATPTPPPAPAPPAAAAPDEGASTVMFDASQFQDIQQQATGAISPEDQKAHEEAKRFARLVVSEIKLYNEAKVNEGRRNKDIYARLKEDIERGRQMYADRIQPNLKNSTTYFQDELVRILAGGDASALGPT
jgi:putative methionine-R-sulfoxide reductase with GAF domain